MAEDIFIALFLLWGLFSDASRRNPVRAHVIKRIHRYFVWIGLNAGWRMFSPDPPVRTIWPQACLTLADSSQIVWEPEPFASLSVAQKITQKKFHTYFHQVVRPGVSPRALRDFAEYLLATSPHSASCTTIEIYRIARITPPHPAEHMPSPKAVSSLTLLFTLHPNPSSDAS